jgi:hypothetical protein
MYGIAVVTLFLFSLACKPKRKDDFTLVPGIFTHAPMNPADYKGLVPLGNLNPPGHTYPTDHLYFYLTDVTQSYPVFAMGAQTLTRVKKYTHGGTATDYSLEMRVGGKYYLFYYHVASLEATLEAKIGAINSNCKTYETGGVTHSYCEKDVNIPLTAGQVIGKVGGVPGQNALDVGLARWGNGDDNNTFYCPIDYCDATLKAQLQTRFSNYNGTILRTAPPVCGEVNQGIAGTLQGIWFKKGSPKYPEDPNIAFVHDNINPALPAISVGTSQTNFPAGVYSFPIAGAGTVNRDFKEVKPGSIFCFDNFTTLYGGVIPGGKSMIVSFVTADEVQVEVRNACNCTCMPYSFGAAAVSYTRGK